MLVPFLNRSEAGKYLAARLTAFENRADVVVLGLPRGGVPVAWEVARVLAVPLDVCIVRKLGVPQYPELAFGAIAPGNIVVLNRDVISSWNVSPAEMERVTAIERRELFRRERLYRQGRSTLDLTGKTVIVVDDGIATGATLKAAISVLRQQHPRRIVVATPVAPREAYAALQVEADSVVCLTMPEPFRAIGEWYVDFDQTSDAEVQYCLRTAICMSEQVSNHPSTVSH